MAKLNDLSQLKGLKKNQEAKEQKDRARCFRQLKESWDTNDALLIGRVIKTQNGFLMNKIQNPDGEYVRYPGGGRVNIWLSKNEEVDHKSQYWFKFKIAPDKYREKTGNKYLITIDKKFDLQKINAASSKGRVSPTCKNQLNDIENTIEEIYNENINLNSPYQVINQANSVESLATDIYSENKRFIYELIQNADDAAIDENAELEINILNNYVILSHNGSPFDSRDIRGLCGVGVGTKTDDATKTGYKGIGFKSVFGQPDGLVYVKSEETLFRFDREYVGKKSWNKSWGDREKWEKKNQTKFVCPWQMMPILSTSIGDPQADSVIESDNFTVKTAIKIREAKQLIEDISSLFEEAKFMLFLRRVSKVSLVTTDFNFVLEKADSNVDSGAVTLLKNKEVLSSWLVKNWIHSIPEEVQQELKGDRQTPKKIQEMQKTEIAFAVKLDNTSKNLEALNPAESPIYSYLPTSVTEFDFPFIVNCNFLLDAGREKIHKNRIWNKWLFKVIGYKTIECCNEMANSDLYSDSYLSLLRNGFYDETDELKSNLNEGLMVGFETFPIVRTEKGELLHINEIIFDSLSLSDLGSEIYDKLSLFYTSSEQNSLSKNIVKLADKNKVLLKYKVPKVEESHLQEFFSSHWIEGFVKLENNFKVLKFLYPFEENDASGKWFIVLHNNRYIINDDGDVDYIKGVCFPSSTPSDAPSSYKNRIIHPEVYSKIETDEAILEWLKKLGVKEPGSIAYLEKEIIEKLPEAINQENSLEIIQFILPLHLKGVLTEEHYVGLQDLPLITNNGLQKAKSSVLPINYNPTIDLYGLDAQLNAISDNYTTCALLPELRVFFKCIGVRDDIEFNPNLKYFASELPAAYVNMSNSFAKEGHSYPHLIGRYIPNNPTFEVSFYIQGFSFLEKTEEENFSKIFWDRITYKYHVKHEVSGTLAGGYGSSREYNQYKLGYDHELKTLDRMNWGRFTSNRVHVPSYFLWFIENKQCLPTLRGQQKAGDVFINSKSNLEIGGKYLPILDLKEPINSDWAKFLRLKFEPKLNDLLIVLSRIAEDVKKSGKLVLDDHRRIGVIYNRLMQLIDNDRDTTLIELNKWSNHGLLVSSDRKALLSKNLLWIKSQGFESCVGFNSILLPSNVDRKNPFFETFLVTLGVRIVDELSYSAIGKRQLFDLKIKLLEIIGPLSLLQKKRLYIGDLDKYIYERFTKVKDIDFFRCDDIIPIFHHENEEIKGSSVEFHFNNSSSEFLIANNWRNPVFRMVVSSEFSQLIASVRMEKETLMFLGFTVKQINETLTAFGCDVSEYQDSSSYKEIQCFIDSLRKGIGSSSSDNSSLEINLQNSSSEGASLEDAKQKTENQEIDKIELDFKKEVEEFISSLEDTEWKDHIPELKNLLDLGLSHPREKQKAFNLIAKLKLAQQLLLNFDSADTEYNRLDNYIVHSARGVFAFIHPQEILLMHEQGLKMALDFGPGKSVRIYDSAEEILGLNINHLLLYQNEKTIQELLDFCSVNRDANKHLLIVDKENSRTRSKEILRILNSDYDDLE